MARKLVLYIAASLDNYIARPDGDVDWLHAPEFLLPGEDYGYSKFYGSIDTTLMGHNTYRIIRGFDQPFPYTDTTNFVFSRSRRHKDTDQVTFISGDIIEFVRELKKEKGRDIWLIGGGQINTVMLNNGLIDRLILTLIPITLGAGIPLFQGDPKEVRFKPVDGNYYENGIVQWILSPVN
jgi:dihydrofolate reductase